MPKQERSPDPPEAAGSLSFKEIYLAHFDRVFAFMCTRLGNREGARDLTQEVFLRLMKTNPRPSSIRTDVIAYLYGIARKVLADHFSGVPAPQTVPIAELVRSPDEIKESWADVDKVLKSLEKLKEIDRVILNRHFWLGEGHVEIASKLGMTPARVRQRFRRALRRLEKELSKKNLSRFRYRHRHNDKGSKV